MSDTISIWSWSNEKNNELNDKFIQDHDLKIIIPEIMPFWFMGHGL